jgi:cytochrome c oxidase cbb3-type subunit 1
LTYSFVESLTASYPFYFMRFLGGVLVVSGFILMAYNMFKTIGAKDGSLKPVEAT